ncbi:MAG TPA: Ig-like domain-containing protein, partial [Thermoanaerobaculia bacterium]|nr:Ig-like domain-containing protein [Thermoanaerobaculia bacterium]
MFRSDDGAARWSPVERNPLPGLTGAGSDSDWICGEILALAASPTTFDVAFAASRHALMRTTDGGATWGPIGPFLNVESIAFSPSDAGVLYISNHRQVWRSDDGGDTWHAGRGLARGVSVNTLTVDPRSPLTVYAATDQGSYRSTDGGLNWVRGRGLASAELLHIVVDLDDPAVLYAIERFENIWKSEDQGLTWTLIAAFQDRLNLTDLELDPFFPGALYLTANATGIKPLGRVLRSLDRGETWTPVLTTDRIHDLDFDPQRPGRVYVATDVLGVFRSEDSGLTWMSANEGMTVTDVQVFTKKDGEVCFRAEDSTATITIHPINDAPVADNDAYSVAEGGMLTQPAPGVLDGDTDAEGDALTAVLVTGPANASSFTLNADGSFTYTHNGSETLTDSFTYRA